MNPAAGQLFVTLEVFDAINPKRLQLHHVMLFLAVAEHQPVTYRQLEDRLDTSGASICRSIGTLSGLGLVRAQPDPDEGRRLLVTLTAKGRALMRQVAEKL